MKAVVLCAGLGTRLAPLTYRVPKPLVPVANRAALDRVLDRLAEAGITDVGVNLHHLADPIEHHLRQRGEGPRVHIVREPEILETGGGIAHFTALDAPLLVHNVDVVTDIDIAHVIKTHETSGADVTMALVDDARFNVVRVAPDGVVRGIRGEGPETRFTLSGIYALSQRFLKRLTPGRKHSVIEAIVAQMNEAPGSVRGIFPRPHTYWRDLGHVDTYLDLHHDLLSGHGPRLPGLVVPQNGKLVSPTASIDAQARLDGCVAVGDGCVIGPDVHLTDCVVIAGTRLSEGFSARRAVILDDLVIAA